MRLRRLLIVGTVSLAVGLLLDVLLRNLVPILVLPPVFVTLGRAVVGLAIVLLLVAAWTWEEPGSGRR